MSASGDMPDKYEPYSYHAMSEDEKFLSNYEQWDSDALGLFFQKRGLGEYSRNLKQHKITGKLGKSMPTGSNLCRTAFL